MSSSGEHVFHKPRRKRAGIGTAVHEELRQIGLLGLILIKVSVVVFGFILRILRLQRR